MRIDHSRQSSRKAHSSRLRALREFKQITGTAAFGAMPRRTKPVSQKVANLNGISETLCLYRAVSQ